MPKIDAEQVAKVLWRPTLEESRPQIFAILDAARAREIYPTLLVAGVESLCLYRGELDPDLASAAPYLIALERGEPFTEWLLGQGWGESWGIFLESAAPIEALRRHFRRFLMVYDHSGKPLYFRYYDPRVLRSYLPTCNTGELGTLFGPVRRYYLESEDAAGVMEYTLRHGVLGQETHRVVAEARTLQ